MEYKGIPPINILEEATRKELFFDENLAPIPVKDSLGDYIKPNSKALSQLLLNTSIDSEVSASITVIKGTKQEENVLFIKFVDA